METTNTKNYKPKIKLTADNKPVCTNEECKMYNDCLFTYFLCIANMELTGELQEILEELGVNEPRTFSEL